MSLKRGGAEEVPEETQRVARAAFPKGNFCLKLRDEMGPIYHDEQFADMFSSEGQPALSPWRLALVCILQHAEGLSDRQAANMVRSRLDWKYLLALPLDDPGFDASVLPEFRDRLIEHEAGMVLLDRLLTIVRERKLLKTSKQRTDATHLIAAVRQVNRLEMIGETLRQALNVLAAAAPDWVVVQIPVEWFDTYSRRIENYRLPEKEKDREEWAVDAGVAGLSLLQTFKNRPDLGWLLALPAVQILERMWGEQFIWEDGPLRLRSKEEMPAPGERLHSPYDVDARYATKRDIHWLGYKGHLTETCGENGAPNLITQVETTAATVADVKVTESIQLDLAKRGLKPDEHIVDGAYISSEEVIRSKTKEGINLVGPLRSDASWQGRINNPYSLDHFKIDWAQQKALCPQGQESEKWEPDVKLKGQTYIRVWFNKDSCAKCPVKVDCTKAKQTGRILQLREQSEHEALAELREQQIDPKFKALYNLRAGIEGTLSQGVRMFDLRHSRYRNLPKTHLQNIFVAIALNMARLWSWWEEKPRACTRVSRLKALAPQALALAS